MMMYFLKFIEIILLTMIAFFAFFFFAVRQDFKKIFKTIFVTRR